MKKAVSLLLTVVMILSLTLTGCAAEIQKTEIVLQVGNNIMLVNGAEKSIDENGTAPLISDERTLLPVRALIDELGGTVSWEETAQTVTLIYGEDVIKLTIGNTTAYLNGDEMRLDTAPAIINGRTMLPIRFIADSFGLETVWDGAEQRITITKSKPDAAPVQVSEKHASKSLVAYFSATGTTKALAEKIAKEAGADIFEILPETPYTSDDLKYTSDCRANREQYDDSARPKIANSLENIGDYDVVLLGYPIWHGKAPKIIYTFLESYDLSGKIIMPFCTSGSSGIGGSLADIGKLCPHAEISDGFRGTASTGGADIQKWLGENNFLSEKRIKLTANGSEIVIKLDDNNTAKSFAAMLPLSLDFEDYNNTEKISYLTQKLDISDAPDGITPSKGDLTLYLPWGNLALFYNDFSYSAGLVHIGTVEQGVEHISELSDAVNVELY